MSSHPPRALSRRTRTALDGWLASVSRVPLSCPPHDPAGSTCRRCGATLPPR